MKKIFLLCLFVFISAAASAQKVTEKDLQGNWKMTAFNAGGINVDVATEKITLSKEMEGKVTPQQQQQMQAQMAQAMTIFKTSSVSVAGNSFNQTMGQQQQKGTFTLKEKEGKQYLMLTQENGTVEELNVAISGKMLHIGQGDATKGATFVYIKQ
jgi:hypothetical protein